MDSRLTPQGHAAAILAIIERERKLNDGQHIGMQSLVTEGQGQGSIPWAVTEAEKEV